MLLLIAAVAFGVFLFRRNLRLEGAAEANTDTAVRAYVDGKPVRSYVKE